jgi:WD40 repeat protein
MSYGATALAFSEDGRRLASGHDTGKIRVWNIDQPKWQDTPIRLSDENDYRKRVKKLVFGADRGLLASISGPPGEDGRDDIASAADTAALWMVSGGARGPLFWPKNTVPPSPLCLAFHPKQSALVTGDVNGHIRFWYVSPDCQVTEDERQFFNPQAWDVLSLAFNGDGSWMGSGHKDGTARLCNLAEPNWQQHPTILRASRNPDESIRRVAFSPDGMLFATGSADGVVRLWRVADAAEDRPRDVLYMSNVKIQALAFSQDGEYLIVGDDGGAVRLWRQEGLGSDPLSFYWRDPMMFELEPASAIVDIVATAEWLIVSTQDKRLLLWRLGADDLIDIAPSIVHRELTTEERREFYPVS